MQGESEAISVHSPFIFERKTNNNLMKRKRVEKPAYYAIIPAHVRYNQNIPPNAKLLYGEVTAMTQVKGYCYARNSYFKDLYDVHVNSVTRWISKLCEERYLINVQIYDEAGDFEERRLYLPEAFDADEVEAELGGPNIFVEGVLIKLFRGGKQNCIGALNKIVEENNIKGNTTMNTTRESNGGQGHTPPQPIVSKFSMKDKREVYEFSKKAFSEFYKKVAGQGLIKSYWKGKEGKNIKLLNDKIRENVEVAEGDCDLPRWKSAISNFYKKLGMLEDGWYKDNALSPSGFLKYYNDIYLKILKLKNGSSKNTSRSTKEQVGKLFGRR